MSENDRQSAVTSQSDLDECWCCDGLHDSPGTLCPDCKEAGCNRFTDECESDHKPVLADGGRAEEHGQAILHVFADHGVEAEVLTQFGDVTRLTLNPREYDHSHAIRGDASVPEELPFEEGAFDLVVAHPPCTAWSDMPSANKDGDAPELIAEAREIGRRYGDHYIVENKPAAPLHDPTVLEGRMFGLPISYERAFETSFDVPQPPSMGSLGVETSPFYYSERSHEWWAAAKGYPAGKYPKEHMAKNCIPAPYIRHLVRAWLTATESAAGVRDYSNYDAEMDEQRARAANASLGDYE